MKITQFLTAAALSAALVFAQGHGPGGAPPDPATAAQMRVAHLASALNLTDTQKAQATKIFTDSITASESLRSSLKTNHQALADAIKTNNTASIDQLTAAAGTAEGQLMAIDAKANAAFYQILTPDQQTTFNGLHQRGFGRGGPGGPGGPGASFRGARSPRP